MHLTQLLTTLTLAGGLLAATQAPARAPELGSPIPALDPERTVSVVGPIRDGNVIPLGSLILQWATMDPATPISIIIDSPGGEVTTGFLFINQMEMAKSLGATLNCYVPGMAASMAFSILTHCSNRYALTHSFLLWHRVRVRLGEGEVLTVPAARALATDLARLDSIVLGETLNAVDMDQGRIRYHFEHETLHVAFQLAAECPNFLTVSDNIPGLTDAMYDKRIPSSAHKGVDLLREPDRIQYIWTNNAGK